jgi:DNA-binding GntR family transcriptional regulator
MARYGTLSPATARHSGAMIDHGSPVPVYRQVIAILRRKIESGEYAPGQRLPSAVTLSQEYGIAVLTGRRVLQALVGDGLAVMTPGKGTFVAGGESDDEAEGTSGAHDDDPH